MKLAAFYTVQNVLLSTAGHWKDAYAQTIRTSNNPSHIQNFLTSTDSFFARFDLPQVHDLCKYSTY